MSEHNQVDVMMLAWIKSVVVESGGYSDVTWQGYGPRVGAQQARGTMVK